MDVLMKFTFLNVENPEEIKNGIIPIVREIGPFTYKEVRRKENILYVEEFISYGR